jgi:hypothetical protein
MDRQVLPLSSVNSKLAAIRLFLEDGRVLTDAAEIRRAYLDRFVTPTEDHRALDFFLRVGSETADGTAYAAALKLQAREYDAVEALLRRDGAFSDAEDRPAVGPIQVSEAGVEE